MSLLSGFYVVTSYLEALGYQFGAFVGRILYRQRKSSPGGNFSPVSGDELTRSIRYGFADAHADDHALPEIRDSILYWHLVIYRGDLPSVRVENSYALAGGTCRHSHTPAKDVRREALNLLAIAEHLDSL